MSDCVSCKVEFTPDSGHNSEAGAAGSGRALSTNHTADMHPSKKGRRSKKQPPTAEYTAAVALQQLHICKCNGKHCYVQAHRKNKGCQQITQPGDWYCVNCSCRIPQCKLKQLGSSRLCYSHMHFSLSPEFLFIKLLSEMNMMKQLYQDGDDDMKRQIAKSFAEGRGGKTPDLGL